MSTSRAYLAGREAAERTPQDAYLRWTALLFAAGFGMHAADHVRRGMSAATTFIMIGGATEALSIAVAVVMVLTRRAWAPQAAIVVGFGSAVASTYGHLLPTFAPGYQDSFVSLPHMGVTWFSWLSLAAAMVTGILFGFAGLLPHVKMRAKADSLPHVNVRAC